jgi:hypothetical protein
MATYEKLFSSSDAIMVELEGDEQGNGVDYGARFKEALTQLGRELGSAMSNLPDETRPSTFEVTLRVQATANDGLAIVPSSSGGHFVVRICWGEKQGIDLGNILGR